MRIRRFDIPWAGLLTGPLFWALSFNTNYALAPWQCANKLYPVPWLAILLAAFAASGGLISWRSWRAAGLAEPGLSHAPHTDRFLAGLGMMAAALFTAIILLHVFAGLVFDGCER